MNRKQLTLLVLLVAVIGGFGLALYKSRQSDWESGKKSAGQKLLGEFPLNDIAQVTIKQSSGEVNLVRKDDGWRVRERGDYPASFDEISDLIRKLWELKPVQAVKAGSSHLGRLQLLEPGKGKDAGTLVDLKDKGGKTVKAILLGKQHMKESPQSSSPMGGGSWPNGRFVMIVNQPASISLVSEAFSDAEAKAERWLKKDFFKVEKIKSIAVKTPVATNDWQMARESESGTWKLAALKPGEEMDTNKVSGVSGVLASPSFTDLAAPGAKPEETGMDKPTVATVETFDGFSYTLKLGKAKTDENYYLAMSVQATLTESRKPGKDEKAEDKEKLDKEFQEQLKKLKEKLQTDKIFENWTFLVSKWTVDQLLKERKDWLVEKKEPEKKEEAQAPEGHPAKPAATEVPKAPAEKAGKK